MFRRHRHGSIMAAPRGNLDDWANGSWLNDCQVINSQRSANRRAPYGMVGRAANRANQGAVRARNRDDQPVVRIAASADSHLALAAAENAESQRQAVEELRKGTYAATSQAPQAALLRTWERFRNAWFSGCKEVYPLTPTGLKAVAAMFRAGNYSSFRNYAFAVKGQRVRMGYLWTQQMDKLLRDCIRAVNRGIGESKRSEPLDLMKAVNTTWGWPTNMNDLEKPIGATALILVACTYMCREIEVAGALEYEFCVHEDGDSCPSRLPVTKKDQEARGVTRTVECWCDLGIPCVSHYMLHYLRRLRAFGVKKGIDNDVMPLFPNPEGRALSKPQVNMLIKNAVSMYDSTISPEALERFSAHTFRITGARWYASMGIDCATIALHGRWSSSAVLTYLAEAPLNSMKAKMRPSKLLSDANNNDVWRNNACHEVKNRLRAADEAAAPAQLCEDDESNAENIGYVLNMMSSMVRIQKNTSTEEQSHNWVTRCGWKWAGKSHVHSSAEEPLNIDSNWKKCPKCYHIKRDDDSDDSSSSSSSESSWVNRQSREKPLGVLIDLHVTPREVRIPAKLFGSAALVWKQ